MPIDPAISTAIRRHIRETMLAADAALSPEHFERDSRVREVLDLGCRAAEAGLISVTTTADLGHCGDCSIAIFNLALDALTRVGLQTSAAAEVITVTEINSREELEALFEQIGLGANPKKPH